jgi:enoyl-CoA hydratase/carnithine racemase
MDQESFFWELADGIGTIRLHDPERLNALTFETYEKLERLTASLDRDDAVQVVVITGAGKGFCSGGNVEEIIGALVQAKSEARYRFTRMTCALVKNMRRTSKPIVAAVNGIAAGAGAMLALASDIRILSDRASFAFLFGKVGLSGADMGALYLLPRIVGQGRAAELLFLGDSVDAREAYRIGLANRVVAEEKLLEESYRLARRLRDGPRYSLAVTKELLNLEADIHFEAALEMEAQAQARCMEMPDFAEGYRAFVEKRAPVFNRS